MPRRCCLPRTPSRRGRQLQMHRSSLAQRETRGAGARAEAHPAGRPPPACCCRSARGSAPGIARAADTTCSCRSCSTQGRRRLPPRLQRAPQPRPRAASPLPPACAPRHRTPLSQARRPPSPGAASSPPSPPPCQRRRPCGPPCCPRARGPPRSASPSAASATAS